jgi:hypothetical protein
MLMRPIQVPLKYLLQKHFQNRNRSDSENVSGVDVYGAHPRLEIIGVNDEKKGNASAANQ